jgi:sugar/nucleoside kinase (ribokinase family)
LGERESVSFDPNIRPALVGDRDTAGNRFERLASLADLVKLSDEDLAFLYPDLRPEETASDHDSPAQRPPRKPAWRQWPALAGRRDGGEEEGANSEPCEA